MQYTEKPSASNCLFRLTCRGRSVLPGAFNSMKAILPPGRSTRRSGTPSRPGLVNFGARPPFVRTACTSFASIVFSRIMTSCVLKTRKVLYTRKCGYCVLVALYSFFFRYIRKVRNTGTRPPVFFGTYGAAAVPINVPSGYASPRNLFRRMSGTVIFIRNTPWEQRHTADRKAGYAPCCPAASSQDGQGWRSARCCPFCGYWHVPCRSTRTKSPCWTPGCA